MIEPLPASDTAKTGHARCTDIAPGAAPGGPSLRRDQRSIRERKSPGPPSEAWSTAPNSSGKRVVSTHRMKRYMSMHRARSVRESAEPQSHGAWGSHGCALTQKPIPGSGPLSNSADPRQRRLRAHLKFTSAGPRASPAGVACGVASGSDNSAFAMRGRGRPRSRQRAWPKAANRITTRVRNRARGHGR